MEINFNHKTVLIGGSTSGIGLSIAQKFSKNGATVILLGRDKNKLVEVIENLKKKDGDLPHEYIVADFENIEQLELKVKRFIEAHGYAFDIIVNNVGGPMPKLIKDINSHELERYYKIQFLSFYVVVKASLDNMIKKKSGRIINIVGTSIKSTISQLGTSTSKSNIIYWAKTLSEEVGKYGITVNSILPGPTNTRELSKLIEFFSKQQKIKTGTYMKRLKEEIALNRIAEPDEIADVVLFVASNHAAYMTGSNITVDGGFSKCLF